MRHPVPRQGTIVCAHMHLGMKQFYLRLIPPFLQKR